jgi:hypothetical protein
MASKMLGKQGLIDVDILDNVVTNLIVIFQYITSALNTSTRPRHHVICVLRSRRAIGYFQQIFLIAAFSVLPRHTNLTIRWSQGSPGRLTRRTGVTVILWRRRRGHTRRRQCWVVVRSGRRHGTEAVRRFGIVHRLDGRHIARLAVGLHEEHGPYKIQKVSVGGQRSYELRTKRTTYSIDAGIAAYPTFSAIRPV